MKNPNNLRLPKVKMLSKKNYKDGNLDLKKDVLRQEEASYNSKMTVTKYLPTLSVQGQYTNGDLNPLFPNNGMNERYYNYGFSVSMPIDINAFSDIEASKVANLRAATQILERKDTIEQEYKWIKNSLTILDRRINLAKKDEKVYSNLLRSTKDLVDAGEKTSLDSDIMSNSLNIRKLDQQIYYIDKQLKLLQLYIRVENVL